MEVLLSWFVTNQDFLIVGLLATSLIVGVLVEFSKKGWAGLADKIADSEKQGKFKVFTAWFSQILAAVLVILCLACVSANIAIPGGKACLPIWFSLDYILQYLVSCYGLKCIKFAIANRTKKENVKVVKAVKDPDTGELTEV